MKKNYKTPVLEIYKVETEAFLDYAGMGSKEVSEGQVKDHSSDIDDEVYESEDGNYGDLW